MFRSWTLLLFLAIPIAHAVEPALTFGEDPSYVPAAAKGDLILQTTEAADAVLYWDGKGFVWKEDPEGY